MEPARTKLGGSEILVRGRADWASVVLSHVVHASSSQRLAARLFFSPLFTAPSGLVDSPLVASFVRRR